MTHSGVLNHVTKLALVALLALLLIAPQARAQGTDLDAFTATGAPPNIALMIDTSGSMDNPPSSCSGFGCDSKLTIAKDAVETLVTTVNPPDGSGGYENNARFGLFGFGGVSTKPGALLYVPIDDDTNQAVIDALLTIAKSSIGTPLGGVLLDIGRYFAGSYGWGAMETWGSVSSDVSAPSPIDVECRKNFVVFMSDGLVTNPRVSKVTESAFCAAIGDSDADGVEGVCTNSDYDWLDDIAYSMYRNDFSALPGTQNLTVHTIGFDVNDPLMEDAAANGGGLYQTTNDSAGLVAAFLKATENIFKGTVSFTAASVPSSKTQFEDAFFVAYFSADTSTSFWPGHVEAYRISPTAGVLDKNGNAALDSSGAFLEPRYPVWDAGERLLDAGHPARTLYTTLGGARTALNSATETDLDVLVADLGQYPNDPNVPIPDTATLRTMMLDYVEGLDAFDEDRDSNSTEKRSDVLGDPFHSSPIVIGPPPHALAFEDGFGPAATPGTFLNMYQHRDRVLYVGANDGMFHAFDAGGYNLGDNPATTEIETDYYDLGTGNELFGWVPGMLLDSLKYLPRNSPRTRYWVDGSPTAADAWLPSAAGDTTKDPDEWATVMITGMREGGAGYLALDVTDPTAIAGTHGPYPKLLWEFADPNEPLAEAWSDAIITRVKLEGALSSGDNCGADDGDGDCKEVWVAIFSGGYDASGDGNATLFTTDPNDPNYTTAGQALFIVDLQTGAVLAKLAYDPADPQLQNMIYAIPSTPAVLDLDFDGFVDVIYVGDTGGQMWKWDISDVGSDANADSLIDNWTRYGVFFKVDPELVGSAYHYRSFFFPPSATFIDGDLTLGFATGERANLHYAGNATADENNRLYVIKDDEPTGGNAIPATPFGETNLTDITASATDTDLTDEGFFIVAEDGEKFVSNHLIFGGFFITTSYSPADLSADVCAGGSGTAFVYIVDLEGGTGFFGSGSGTSSSGRRLTLGSGVPSDPQISVSAGSGGVDSTIMVQTSGGSLMEIDGPSDDDSPVELVYWKQDF